jgi:hypothetical protein
MGELDCLLIALIVAFAVFGFRLDSARKLKSGSIAQGAADRRGRPDHRCALTYRGEPYMIRIAARSLRVESHTVVLDYQMKQNFGTRETEVYL